MRSASDGLTEAGRALLARTPLVVRRGPYALAAWAPSQISAVCQGLLRARAEHGVVILDEREASAFLPESALAEMPPARSLERGWALLTLDETLPWETVGILAALASALARAGVPLGVAAAFSRDHIYMHLDHVDTALAALRPLVGEIRILD